MRRRGILRVAGGAAAAAAGMQAAWAAREPAMRVRVVRHRILPAAWPADLPPLTIACIADPHIGAPDTPPGLLAQVVERTNALRPDMVALLGDYGADHRIAPKHRPGMAEVAAILAELRAPLGVHAILGNHDWWEDPDTQGRRGKPLPEAAEAFARAGLPVLHNESRLLRHAGRPLRVAGLGSQWAYYLRRGAHGGAHDLERTLDGAGGTGGRATGAEATPTILLAHEPDIFPVVPAGVAVTLAGHTHGGQVRMGTWSPVVPSRFGNRYAYGHVEEGGRHLVVSGGIGSSLMPLRFGVPPEITLVELGAADEALAAAA